MTKTYINKLPSRVSDISLDEFIDEIGKDWEYRARRLRARRWRALKRKSCY